MIARLQSRNPICSPDSAANYERRADKIIHANDAGPACRGEMLYT